MLPNFVIAGVNKSGTTSLFSYIAHHPNVCPSSVKETCYFLPVRYREKIDDIAKYKKFFSSCVEKKIVMEATPGYFYGGEELASFMQEVLVDVSVLIIFREPVERLLSFFKSLKKKLWIPSDMSLKAYIEKCEKQSPDMLRRRENDLYFGLEGGCYSRYLPAWQKIFGSKLKVVFFDDLRKDPKLLLKHIASFLDIDGSYFDNIAFDIENKSRGYKSRLFQSLAIKLNKSLESTLRKHTRAKKVLRNIYFRLNERDFSEVIDPATIVALQSYYRPYNKKLYMLLEGRNDVPFPTWLKEIK